jgi:hypothetical protein
VYSLLPAVWLSGLATSSAPVCVTKRGAGERYYATD